MKNNNDNLGGCLALIILLCVCFCSILYIIPISWDRGKLIDKNWTSSMSLIQKEEWTTTKIVTTTKCEKIYDYKGNAKTSCKPFSKTETVVESRYKTLSSEKANGNKTVSAYCPPEFPLPSNYNKGTHKFTHYNTCDFDGFVDFKLPDESVERFTYRSINEYNRKSIGQTCDLGYNIYGVLIKGECE